MALLRPVANHFPISQRFGGHFRWESVGYLQSDARGPRKGMKRYFPGSQRYTDLHLGVDYDCPVGTPIVATESGIVVGFGTYPETGEHYIIFLIHRDSQYTVVTFDTHLSSIIVPTTGYKVRKGQPMAKSGRSGNVTGPHDHHELRVGPGNANPADSGSWMRWDPARFEAGGSMETSVYIVPNVFAG